MKKFFALMIAFALVFTVCTPDDADNNNDNNNGNNPGGNDNNNGNNPGGNTNTDNSDVIGIWTAKYGTGDKHNFKLDIADGTWIMVFDDDYGPASYNGTWFRSANTLYLSRPGFSNSATASLSEGKLFLTQNIDNNNSTFTDWRPSTLTLTKSNSQGGELPGGTTLRIRNESFINVTNVVWNSVQFTTSGSSINTGMSSDKKNVTSGQGYIHFRREGNPIDVRTNAVYIVEEDAEKEYIFRNDISVVETANPANTGTLQTFFSNSWIYITQGTDPIALYGEYDFGSVLQGENKDIVFTIKNIGLANLVLESVDGKRVNLDENTAGYFSVTQQPLASTVAPEVTTSFTIRFNPTAIGTNFSANVIIKSNSQNAEEFAFRVKGNGRDYIFGDTGPGGGMIFYIEGGQYKECSGELGSYSWTDAVTIASNYKGGSFTNWHLPDRGELSLMYNNLHKNGLGGFFSSYSVVTLYWSSVEYSTTSAYYRDFYNANEYSSDYTGKSSAYRVRAVRSFTQ